MKKLSLFMLMAVGLLISGNLRADVVKVGSVEDMKTALSNAPDGVSTEIQLTANIEEINATGGNLFSVGAKKVIVLDLNGFTISYNVTATDKNGSTIANNGILTIKDSSSPSKGKIIGVFEHKDGHTPTIDNKNTLTLENGTIENNSPANGTSYAVDNLNGDASVISFNMKGGVLKRQKKTEDGLSSNHKDPAVRLYNEGSKDVVMEMTGGEIYGGRAIYIQQTDPNSHTVNLNISGGNLVSTNEESGARCIDSQADGTNVCFCNTTITITGGTFDGGIFLNNVPNFAAGTGIENVTISGGNFVSHNAMLPYKAEMVKFLTGGTYFFDKAQTTRWDVMIPYILFDQVDSKTGQKYAVDFSGYAKYYDLETQAKWEALGYQVEKTDTPEGKTGTWYTVKRKVDAATEYPTFLTYIADGYTAVDITGQDNGNGGKWPDKTVEIKKVETKNISGGTPENPEELPATEPNDAVVIQSGAYVTIKENTTVEAYSVTVPTGSTLTVEPNATLIVGAGGVTTAENEDPISINIGSADGSGAIKISPDAPAEKAQPRVRVQLTTIAHIDQETHSWHWQYFARPTGVDPESFKVVSGTEHGATEHYLKGYRGETNNYEDIILTAEGGLSQLKNYEGYAICNNSTTGGVVYQFEGKLNGNQNAEITFKNKNFTLMGNSYLAPVSMKGLFKGIIEGATAPEAPSTAPAISKAPTEEGGNAVEWTIWVYDCANKRFVQTTSLQASQRNSQLQPMQGFFMRLREGTSLTAAIDYVGAVWNNNAQAGPILAPAHNDNGMGTASIVVSANGCADQIDLFEDVEFDNSFNNGADASKLMNLQGMFNLYAQTEAGTLSCVATDNMEGTILTFQANNASEYELSFNGVANMNYSLIDLFNGEVIEMADGNVYKFNATPNSTEARFQIVEGYKAPTAMEKVNNVKAVKGIFSMTGAYMGEVKDFNALPAGVYVVNGQQIVK